jgi:putative redox protein
MAANETAPDWQRWQAGLAPGTVLVAGTGTGFEQVLLDGRHMLHADEPASVGGADAGPNPYELLLMALGACTSMTIEMYARRKVWPLERALVRLSHAKAYAEDCIDCEKAGAKLDRITRTIELVGPLDAAQRARLLQIAELCPVHKTLTGKIEIRTTLVEA